MGKKFLLLCMSVIAIALAFSGCGETSRVVVGQHYYTGESASAGEAAQEEDGEEAANEETAAQSDAIGTDLFMVMSVDMQGESLILEQIATGKQYLYYYSLTTRFLDKYGNHTTVSAFEPGKVVTIGSKDEEGRLLQLQISDEVWEYSDIVRFSIDADRGIFCIAGTNYSYDSDLYIVSDGEQLWISELDSMDELRVIGIGKKILSVAVTSGHGNLELQNTDLFNGSYIQIGKTIFSEITENMTMELPEGTYTVTVANNGYGGSAEITIERGETTTLNLDELKGEGPKYGSILFAIDVLDAQLLIDGEQVDYSEAVSLQYGLHSLVVMADSYATYIRKLYVNSSEATIVIALRDEDTVSTSDTTAAASSEDTSGTSTSDSSTSGSSSATAGSLAGSLAGSTSSSGSSSGSSSSSSSTSALDAATIDTVVNELLEQDSDSSSSTDYISTLSELLSVITGSD